MSLDLFRERTIIIPVKKILFTKFVDENKVIFEIIFREPVGGVSR